MNENWIEYTKRADFRAWAEKLKVSPLTARLIRNRDIETVEEAEKYLFGTLRDLADPYLMKDMDRAVELLFSAAEDGAKTAIVSDFDDDGIFAGEILYEGFLKCGLSPVLYTPDRVQEGYGINRRIIDEAKKDGCTVLVTCDNGIAAVEEIAYAKSLGLTVIVTDHHEPQEKIPEADAVLDPKQEDCGYPFKSLCGAGVAFRLIQALYALRNVAAEEAEDLLEYAAIATVADVVELKGENRILVREGIKRLRDTKKIGLQALIDVCEIEPSDIDTYHIGFIIGPSFNAVGRLSHVRIAFDLLQTKDFVTAMEIAKEIRELNDDRKQMTNDGVEEAMQLIEEQDLLNDPVLVIYLPGVHESVIGIIAGKIKEKYYRPTFVFTDAGDCLKGSARSIEAYHMMQNLLPLKELFVRFGGHAMAAGMSILPENLEIFRRKINETCTLSEKDLMPVVRIDARVPMSQLSEGLIREIEVLSPTGTGNPQPLFAMLHFRIHQMRRIGREQKFLKLLVSDESGVKMEAIMFNDVEEFLSFLAAEFGEQEVEKALHGSDNVIDTAFTYYPEVNSFRGNRSLQIRIRSFKRIHHA